MFAPALKLCFGLSPSRRNRGGLLAAIQLLAACATETASTKPLPETIPSHVYSLPLDNVLTQATKDLESRGWHVQRTGNVLFTNWLEVSSTQWARRYAADTTEGAIPPPNSLVAYRIFGQRVDAGFCTLRVQRLVATPAPVDIGGKQGGHIVDLIASLGGSLRPIAVHNEQRELNVALNPNFQEDAANDAVATGVPGGMVVTQVDTDSGLELALQQRIDPQVAAVPKRGEGLLTQAAPTDAGAPGAPPPQSVSLVQPRESEGRPTALAGIWTGKFTFTGRVTGSFSGEVPVAVDGDFVDVEDFCPEAGGTLAMQASGNAASWQGNLVCPSIRLKACPSATFTYDFATASLSGGTLAVVASGTVDTDARCNESTGISLVSHTGGSFGVAFIAQKADYVHLTVTRTKRVTSCVWPKDWEDFSSSGSMAMPEPPLDDSAYLGIIRAKGSRLADIERLLRHCHHVVLLHGQPVLMRVAVTRHDVR